MDPFIKEYLEITTSVIVAFVKSLSKHRFSADICSFSGSLHCEINNLFESAQPGAIASIQHIGHYIS